jgi:ubiquinone/menaquinone biosynthesis C-methylase UbiE
MRQDTPPVCDYEGSDYQASFWDQGQRAYEDQVEAVALSRLLPAGGHRLLELGAGAGRNSSRYAGFQQVVLLDYSLTQLQQAQIRLGNDPRYAYVAANVYRLPFRSGVFDAATMIRVLHHMADAPEALRQVRSILQPGGIFILEFANKQNIKAILRYLLRRQDWSPFDREPVEFARLNFDFHPAAVRGWLQNAGFEILRQLTVSHFRMDFLKRSLPTGLLVKMDSAAQLTGNWWQLTPSVFVAARVPGEAPSQVDATSAGIKDLLACPACGSISLLESRDSAALVCQDCGVSWPVVEGIYDFRGGG